ncbi:hypothetical protein BAE44_0022765 [Dichanthelium oligosanthes]|uniref:F-box domain-containing protein n=1 Tax=Dichanthelium oligosanthes TaxID=888268 RepID=A0A1E5UTT8_9POAL|nr:hypothetical protein BAE44_0022765 [Dichanthelium oligosanthes]
MEKGMSPIHGAAAGNLPDDLIVEILARLPAGPLCRCKCVSRSWRALISDPAQSARLPQTLSGFFVFSRPHSADAPSSWSFISLSPPFHACRRRQRYAPGRYGPLLPSPQLRRDQDARLLQRPPPPALLDRSPVTSSFLRRLQPRHRGVGCLAPTKPCPDAPGQKGNPQGGGLRTTFAALGFDPAASSYFYVFQLAEQKCVYDDAVKAVEIYSSEIGTWITRQSGWDVFFSGRKTYFKGFCI